MYIIMFREKNILVIGATTIENFLNNIGNICYKYPKRVLGAWLVVALVLALCATFFYKAPGSEITIPGIEAQKGMQKMEKLFPDAGKGSAQIVIATSDGSKLTAFTQPLNELTEKLSAIDGVKMAINPLQNPGAISKDEQIGLLSVQLSDDAGTINQTTVQSINNVLQKTRQQTDLTVEVGGDLANKVPHKILGPKEGIGVLVAALVLVLTFGSLLSAGMPIAVALSAVGISMAGLFSLSRLVDINSTTPALAVMLGLAVGIDYSLFILSRYRTLLSEGISLKEAPGKALKTAGSAVVFAAGTVIIALIGLSVLKIPFITVMGLSAATTVAVAALASITLLPTFFRLAGEKILSKKAWANIKIKNNVSLRTKDSLNKKAIWYKWGVWVSKRPLRVMLIAILIIGVIAIPAKSMKLGMITDQYAPKDTSERKAYDLISKGFGPGYNAPLAVVVEGLSPMSSQELDAYKQNQIDKFKQAQKEQIEKAEVALNEKLAKTPNYEDQIVLLGQSITAKKKMQAQEKAVIKKIDSEVETKGPLLHLYSLSKVVDDLPNVEKALPAQISPDGRSGVLQVIPKTSPSDPATNDLINTLRNKDNQVSWAKGVKFTVTGSTAFEIDINQKLANALPLYMAVVVGLSLVLLLAAFRSVLIPIKATLGYLLSVGAMFGALVAVFQWGWLGITDTPGPIISFVPIMATGILFGLAMDYEFFVVSSMKEAYKNSNNAKRAVVVGFSQGSKVVAAAAVIMVSVFAGFISNDITTVKALGFGLSVGIFIDAFIVRMTIVPAVMSLLGKSAWWLPFVKR